MYAKFAFSSSFVCVGFEKCQSFFQHFSNPGPSLAKLSPPSVLADLSSALASSSPGDSFLGGGRDHLSSSLGHPLDQEQVAAQRSLHAASGLPVQAHQPPARAAAVDRASGPDHGTGRQRHSNGGGGRCECVPPAYVGRQAGRADPHCGRRAGSEVG